MSPFLLKIYALLVVVTLVVSSYLIQSRDRTPNENTRTYSSLDQEGQLNKKVVKVKPDAVQATSSVKENTTAEVESVSKTKTSPVTTLDTPTMSFTATAEAKEPVAAPKQEDTIPEETDYQVSYTRQDPCSSPIAYTLGSFDTRFNITKSYFLQITQESAAKWNKALGKTLFEYDSTGKGGDLTVNLIYDDRQALTDKNKLLGEEINNTRAAAKKLEEEYEASKVMFTRLKDEYVAEVESFNARQKIYNDTVTSWNEKGGAPQLEFDALTSEKIELQKIADHLNEKHTTVTSLLNDINIKINKHNELIFSANEKIDQNNLSASKKFTEGNYNSGTNKIIIYQFNDEVKLKRVLTHEFGHALTIGHTKNKDSIMYSVNSGTKTELDDDDIAALKDVCLQN